MSVVVIGGGAIGLYIASRLCASGQHVALLARDSTVTALRHSPIIVQRANAAPQTIPAPPAATTPTALPAAYQRPDIALLCIKGYDTAAAIDVLKTLQPYQVLSLQNGIGNEEHLLHHFAPDRVLAGVVTSSVQHEGGATIRVTKRGGIGIASIGDPPRVRVWSAMFSAANFTVREYPDYRAMKWSKALLNMLGNGIPAILDMPIDAVYRDPRLAALEKRAILELLTVMQQRGITAVNLPSYPAARLARGVRQLPAPIADPLLRRLVGGGRGGKLPSLHGDLQRGRAQTEGSYLYGAVAAAAHAEGIAAPVNSTLAHTLEGIAAGTLAWADYRQQPAHLLAAVAQAAA